MGLCYSHGIGVRVDEKEARRLFDISYREHDCHKSGHNLANMLFTSALEGKAADKGNADAAIAIWEDIGSKGHAGACVMLGQIFHMTPSGLVSRNFTKARANYRQAISLGIKSACASLAVLLLEEFLMSKGASDTELLAKFAKTVQDGSDEDDELCLVMKSLCGSSLKGDDLPRQELEKRLLQFKKLTHTECRSTNRRIVDAAMDESVSYEHAIRNILSLDISVLSAENIATTIFYVGKLFQKSDFSPAFLNTQVPELLTYISGIVQFVEHFDALLLAKTMQGLSYMQLDLREPDMEVIEDALINRADKLLQEKRLPSAHSVAILSSLTMIGVKPNSLRKISSRLVEASLDGRCTQTRVARVSYSMAVLNDLPACNEPLFTRPQWQQVVELIPVDPAEVESIIILSQLHIVARYLHDTSLPCAPRYLDEAVESRIKTSPTQVVRTSKLQLQVCRFLKETYDIPVLEIEKFFGILPVDAFIEGLRRNIIMQIDGPRHFLLNIVTGKICPTPKELLRRRLLPADSVCIHVSAADWDKAKREDKLRLYLTKVFEDRGITLRRRLPPPGPAQIFSDGVGSGSDPMPIRPRKESDFRVS